VKKVITTFFFLLLLTQCSSRKTDEFLKGLPGFFIFLIIFMGLIFWFSNNKTIYNNFKHTENFLLKIGIPYFITQIVMYLITCVLLTAAVGISVYVVSSLGLL